ncbi:ribbon-helix-helix protein, CopG family [Rothia halotolerans]|uniref:type II toxin-antitoxin system VapB family antitoxin n=1 Tax=Rothia halotolerans TaxID=405770 RepID=UPI00101C15AC|nr:ribbon-helix-helix protein, CopG family [Rothia halotolerans]
MTNVLIRGLSDEAVERIDAAASDQGLSRNEFLRRKLEGAAPVSSASELTAADWERSAEAFADLADDDVMDAAWR